jgi:hypothetical protein
MEVVMTVQELIEKLKRYDETFEVVVEEWETGGLMPLTEEPEQRSNIWVPGPVKLNKTVVVLK